MEPVIGIDSILSAWTIRVPANGMKGLSTATSITVVVVTVAIWFITCVWSHSHGVFVSFHNVHLWAPLSTDIVSIAVVITRWSCIVRSVFVFAWGGDHVESGVACAVNVFETDVIFDGSTEEIWLVEVVWVHVAGGHKLDTRIMVKGVSSCSGAGTGTYHEHVFGLSVDIHFNWGSSDCSKACD